MTFGSSAEPRGRIRLGLHLLGIQFPPIQPAALLREPGQGATMDKMGTGSQHSLLINRIAREQLGPAGFAQKGRARFWYDDQRWRAYFVDFQPSSWSKGTYCNVGVMWLWGPTSGVKGHWSFHVSERVETPVGQFVPFQADSADFEPSVRDLAARALEAANRLRVEFSKTRAVADHYSEMAIRGWPGYHRAVALGLTGSGQAARDLFNRVANEADGSHIEGIAELGRDAQSLGTIAPDREAFSRAIENRIEACRETLRLERLTPPLLPQD